MAIETNDKLMTEYLDLLSPSVDVGRLREGIIFFWRLPSVASQHVSIRKKTVLFSISWNNECKRLMSRKSLSLINSNGVYLRFVLLSLVLSFPLFTASFPDIPLSHGRAVALAGEREVNSKNPFRDFRTRRILDSQDAKRLLWGLV